MEWNEFCEKVSRMLGNCKNRLQFNYDNNKISYIIATQEYIYTIDNYNDLRQQAEQYDFERYSICDGNSYESVVDIPDVDSRRRFSIGLEDKLTELIVSDEEADITYSFHEISRQLIWYVIKDFDVRKRVFSSIPSQIFERRCETLAEKDIFSLIKMITRLPLAVYIETNTKKNREQLQRYAKSYLFNIAYNFDFVFKAVTEIDDLFPQRNVLPRRRIQNVSELMAPQLLYKEQLVEQYYMALTSEEPFVKFVGFYHIMEHFYEEVYNEDIFKSVQHIIQHPRFFGKKDERYR